MSKDKFIIETVESSGHITIKDEPRETRTPILERVYKDPNALLEVHRVKPRDQVRKTSLRPPQVTLASNAYSSMSRDSRSSGRRGE